MVNIEELIEKKRQELFNRLNKEIYTYRALITGSIDADIQTLKQTLTDSKDSVISPDKCLELIENRFIYRKIINPKPFGFSNQFLVESNGGTLMVCHPDGSINDKPFYLTVIFEPIKGDKI